jgi:hypothetical protein
MIKSVGIDFHQGKHVVRCLDERAQLCDSFSFQTTLEGLDTFEEHIFRDGSNPSRRAPDSSSFANILLTCGEKIGKYENWFLLLRPERKVRLPFRPKA